MIWKHPLIQKKKKEKGSQYPQLNLKKKTLSFLQRGQGLQKPTLILLGLSCCTILEYNPSFLFEFRSTHTLVTDVQEKNIAQLVGVHRNPPVYTQLTKMHMYVCSHTVQQSISLSQLRKSENPFFSFRIFFHSPRFLIFSPVLHVYIIIFKSLCHQLPEGVL